MPKPEITIGDIVTAPSAFLDEPGKPPRWRGKVVHAYSTAAGTRMLVVKTILTNGRIGPRDTFEANRLTKVAA